MTLPDEVAELVRRGDFASATSALEQQLAAERAPAADAYAALADVRSRAGDVDGTWRWATMVVAAGDDYRAWRTAARALDRVDAGGGAVHRRVAVLSTATVTPLLPCLRLAFAARGIDAQLHEAPFGQYWQEIIDPDAGLRAFDPDVVVLIPDHRAVDVDALVDEAAESDELRRWASPWHALRRWSSADLVQVSFVVPEHDPAGDAAALDPSSRRRRWRRLHERFADEAASASGVSFVDAESLAAQIGKRAWFAPRYWYAAKHPFAMGVAPELARHVAAGVAAAAGSAKKALIVDLDNTLWQGVIGDDGLHGIELTGPVGEAHVAFQRAVADLGRRGVVLAVCSKNDDAVARSPFELVPEMVLGIDDFGAFVANWDPKPDNILRVAQELGLGLDSLVFVDDNPAERAAVRRALPMVDVLELSDDPSTWCDELAAYTGFERGPLTDEDRQRGASYRARRAAVALETEMESIEDFHRSLAMEATIAPVDASTLERVVQLIGKTNQFNLTTRRHRRADVEAMLDDPSWFLCTARLRDRYADHGLVAVVLAQVVGDVLDVDTVVMSCRVIGRTLETVLVAELVAAAAERGLATVRGHYVRSDRNHLVAELWPDHGFLRVEGSADAAATFELAVADAPAHESPITVTRER